MGYGEVRVDGPSGPLVSPVGKEGEFEVDGAVPGPHVVHVTYGKGTCDTTVLFPAARGPVVELGEIPCGK